MEMDDDVVPPLVIESQAAFYRNLDDLLLSHPGKWVAFAGNHQIGIGNTETELYKLCFAKGLARGEFVVRSIEPRRDDDE